MTDGLPLSADKIFVEWATSEGGVGVTAFTDENGAAFLGVYPLNCIGKPSGLPCWFRRTNLMSDVVVGFNKGAPIVVFIDAEVNVRGISLLVTVPFKDLRKYQRHMFAPWGSEAPRYGFTIYPSRDRLPSFIFPYEESVGAAQTD